VVTILHLEEEVAHQMVVVVVKKVFVRAICVDVVGNGEGAKKSHTVMDVVASERNTVADSLMNVDAVEHTCLDGGSMVDGLDLVAWACQAPQGPWHTSLDPHAGACSE